MNIGRHFTLAELTHSNTAKAEGIPNNPGSAALAALQALCAGVLDPLREALGKPITINCAYRGPVLNKRVGGVPNSQHITGQAADMQSPQASVLDLFKLTINLGLPYDQVIYEARSATSKWLHVSHVNGTNRGEIRVAKFGPDGKPQSYPLISKAEALAMTERVSRSRAVALTYEEGPDEPPQPTPAPAARKAAAQKKAGTGVAVKKATAKKAAPTKLAAKNLAAKKSAAKKAVVKQAVVKKAVVKPAVAKKAVAKKVASPKTPAKTAAKKAAIKGASKPAAAQRTANALSAKKS